MRVVGYVLLAVLGVLVLLLLAAVIRTLCMKKKTSDYTPHPDAAREREYAEKLSRMVAYETVSHPDDPELEKFRGFHKLLAELYPTVHEKLEKTEIDGNLLFFWEGKNHDRPLVLMSHQTLSRRRERGSTRRSPATSPTARSGAAALQTQSAASWAFFRRARSCCGKGTSPSRTCTSRPPVRRSSPDPAAASSWTSCVVGV